MSDESFAAAMRALGHPARMRIVRLLATQPECRGTDVFAELPLAQSTVSEHLRVLKDAGLVNSHAVGVGMVYCLVPGILEQAAESLQELAVSAPLCGTGTATKESTCD